MPYSYNGWLAATDPRTFGGLDNRIVPGTTKVRLSPGVRAGDVATVLFYVASQLHLRVESGDLYTTGDEWGYSYRQNRNANNLSCHASGTAFDWNATRHPNGKRGTFTKQQVATIRVILGQVANVVTWGGDFIGTPDEMHFEISGSAAQVAAVAARIRANSATLIDDGDDVNLTDRVPDYYTANAADSLTVGDTLAWSAAHAANARDAARAAAASAARIEAAVTALTKRLEAKGLV